MVGYKLSKNDWVTPFFVIFRSVREILLVTVFCKHPVPILTQYHHMSMSLATKSLATMSLSTIVPRDKFYNRLKQKKRRIIVSPVFHCEPLISY